MSDLYKKLGGRIKEQREKAGMTQEELSEAVGLSQNFLSQLENGRRKPSIDTVDSIASVLKQPLHSFFLFSSGKKTPKKSPLKNYDALIRTLNSKEQSFLSDVLMETASKLRKLRKK
jgi:transcriptional regulator with XRE-family HTH domain